MITLFSSCSVRPLVCEDIQADMEDGQLQFFYILAFVLQGDASSHSSVMHISRLCVMTCVDIMNHMLPPCLHPLGINLCSAPSSLEKKSWIINIQQEESQELTPQ